MRGVQREKMDESLSESTKKYLYAHEQEASVTSVMKMIANKHHHKGVQMLPFSKKSVIQETPNATVGTLCLL